jgi:GTPase SAR1 family protein
MNTNLEVYTCYFTGAIVLSTMVYNMIKKDFPDNAETNLKNVHEAKLKKILDNFSEKMNTINVSTKEKLNLKKFELEKISPGDNIFIIGKSGSGKTTLISKFISHFQDCPVEIVISPTEALERFYIKNVKAKVIYKHYSPDFISRFIKNQITDINDHAIIDSGCFVILDNCLLKADYNNDKVLSDLLVNGYFYQTTSIIATVCPFGFGKYFSTSMDFIFIFRNTHYLYLQCIYEDYFSSLVSYSVFKELMEKYTQDYTCIVIDCKDSGKMYYFN